MKSYLYAVLVLLSTSFLFSCKKEKTDPPAPPFTMEGQWTGKIGSGQTTPASQFALNLKAGGVAERINANGGVSGTGNWQLSENNFTASYTLSSGTVVSLTGTLDKGIKRLAGNWSNGSESGTWNATKE